jgi:DNA-binding CsgD family transcriptional regulator
MTTIQHWVSGSLTNGGSTRTAQVFNTMAQRLHEQFDAQGLLLAAISHDLRTPLARLRLRLEQMADHPQAERCVADLVAKGMTNKKVGARLFLSHHTVDSHLRHVFAKLGINSRRALRDALPEPAHA